MDFALTEEQESIRDLARQIFSENATHERLLELAKSEDWFDLSLWQQLVEANLPGVALPQDCGGSGFGPIELCLVFEELGRHVAQVPLFATAALGAAPIAEFGTPDQQARWIKRVVEDGAILTAALSEVGSSVPSVPRVMARREGDSYRLDGEKQCVPAGLLAAGILVPARFGDGVGLFMLDPQAEGVSLERQISTSGEPQARLILDGAVVSADDLIGDPSRGAQMVEWIVERASLALAAMQVGVAEGALRDTAAYVSQRKQFGRPIATFQGVALRAADAYIDVEAMRSTVYQAAWRLAEGKPAAAEISSAKWWAAMGGMRVVHTAQHLHGGIGSDIEYPIHRYFLAAKQNELLFGSANEQLAKLGARLVSDQPARSEA
jgi:alkylation response protein AidB-like acyl-CoA dehydrogenase